MTISPVLHRLAQASHRCVVLMAQESLTVLAGWGSGGKSASSPFMVPDVFPKLLAPGAIATDQRYRQDELRFLSWLGSKCFLPFNKLEEKSALNVYSWG